MMSRQADLEREMMSMGLARQQARVTRAREQGHEAVTPAGNHLLREAVTTLAAEIEKIRSRPPNRATPIVQPYLQTLKAEVVALITARAVIDQIARKQRLTSAAMQLAGYLEDEARMEHLATQNAVGFANIYRTAKKVSPRRSRLVTSVKKSMKRLDITWTAWPRKERLQIGVTCLELLASTTGIIHIESRRCARGKSHAFVVASEKTLKWLEEAHEHNSVLFPYYLPCVAVPKDWKTPHSGGYHTNAILHKPLVKVRNGAYQKEIEDIEMPAVYSAVNALQRTAWEINVEVLEVMETLWQDGGGIADIPGRNARPLPEKPEDIATNEKARKDWRRAARSTMERNNHDVGNRLQLVKILFMAHKFAAAGRFWYPFTADFRGRVYPVPYFLQPQGPDFARGLLKFAEGHALGPDGAKWLAIHGANCFGVDKVSFEARAAWVHDNEEKILNVGEDPLQYLWWAEADKPWVFLAFCLEWWRFKQNPESFVSHLPVAMDGSNNGLQIFSLLLRDADSGAATNCVPLGQPADIYQDVADELTRRLVAQQTEGNTQERGWATKWLRFVDGRVPRAAAKRPVMVVPYGGTLFSAQKYLMNWYDDAVDAGGEDIWSIDKFNPTMFLARMLWDAIHSKITSARECMIWLQGIADTCCKQGVPIRWTLPTGFHVLQDYKKYQSKRVKTRAGQTIRFLAMREDLPELSTRRQRNGISPNFVHSLDAACVHQTVERLHAEGVRDFSMVHDSYAVHACHVEKMNKALREVYRDIFENDLLADFHSEVSALLPADVVLPLPPKYGDLDVQQLTEATYFFA